MRRKVPVAHLSPVPDPETAPPDWADHSERLTSIWKANQIEAIDEILDDLRGTR